MLLFASGALVVGPGQAAAAPHHHHAAAKKTVHHSAKAKHEAAATYKVRSGDTLYGIAGKLGTTVEALKDANHLKGSALRVGQVLKIPGAETASKEDAPAESKTRARETRAAKAEAPATYKVRRGDTLGKIAAKLGVSVDELRRANHIRHNEIRAGETLKVPGAGAEEAPAESKASAREERAAKAETPTTYKVRRGDTLGKIAARLGVSVDELRRANHIRHNDIRAGETLKVPGAGSAEEAPPKRARAERSAEEAAPAAEPRRASRAEIGAVVEVAGPARSYRVKRGDTLSEVAPKLGVSVSELKRLNHLKSSHLRRGQVLRGAPTTVKAYVVGPGDTVSSIARRFDVSEARLRAANGLGRRGSIHTGQKLKLPSGYRDRGPEAGAFHPPAPPIRTAPATPRATPPSRGYVPPTTVPNAPQAAPTSAPPPSDAQISEMARGRFVWPLSGTIISDFGPKTEGQRNDGINIQATTGDPVRAAAAGDVVYAGDQVPGFGNLVLIKHADGWVTAYGHLSRIEVKMQQRVTQGQEIGLAGATGGVPTPQLHFEVRYAPSPMERARPVDPKLVLPR
jgi:murein DD-endopeptidase MepM/ murein hydrolase activator NlpD